MSILSKIFRTRINPTTRVSNLLRRKNYRKPQKPWRNVHNTQDHRRRLWWMNAGILAAVFATCYMMVPFYRMLCEATGLVGDMEQKDYTEVRNRTDKLNIHRKYRVRFKSEVDPELNWSFEPVQESILVHSGEPALMFYDAYNHSNDPLVGIALYSVFPEDAGYYFSKIQCFCFNQQALKGKERLNMPLFFYLEPEIDSDPALDGVEEIKIIYKFYLARNQELADWIKKQQQWEYEQKAFLRQKRKQKFESEGNQEALQKLIDEEEEDKVYMETAIPEYEIGSMTPNMITAKADQQKVPKI